MSIDITTIEKDNTLARSRVLINENFENLQTAVESLQNSVDTVTNSISTTNLTVSNNLETKNLKTKSLKTDTIETNNIKESSDEIEFKTDVVLDKNITINGIEYNNIFSVHNADLVYQMPTDIVNGVRIIKPSNGSYQYYDFSNYVENDDHIYKISVDASNCKVGQKLVIFLNPIDVEKGTLQFHFGNSIASSEENKVLYITEPTALVMTYVGPRFWLNK